MATERTIKREGMSRPAQWFALMGGAAAWSLHFMLIYVISEWGCIKWPPEYQWLGITATSWLLIAVSVPLALVAAAATWVGYRSDRDLQPGKREGEGSGEEDRSARFNARTGYIMSGLFTFIILYETLPTFYFLQSCGG